MHGAAILPRPSAPEAVAVTATGLELAQRAGAASAAPPRPLPSIDPGTRLQTGPGVPDWTWRRFQLSWSGPIAPEHRCRLWLRPASASLPLALLLVLLVLLLGIGLSQVAIGLGVLLVLRLLALGLRRRLDVHRLAPWRFNRIQMALPLLSIAMSSALLLAREQGSLGSPAMQVAGNGSSATDLNWYQDRIGAETWQITLMSMPIWVYRLLMLI